MRIFHGDDEGVPPTLSQTQLPQRLEGLRLQRLRADTHQTLSPGLNLQQVQEIGRPVVSRHVHRLECPPSLLCDELGVVDGHNIAVCLQQVEHGQAGCRAAVGPAMPFEGGHLVCRQFLAPFRQEP
jgi:hypothetical protein